ncbi:hypothetical protein Glove_74g261 [Diversispora epigaea]|uniref:Uncharacterized protein n=1 Tax=Diversispora epigaea TaxID=1348612 RepID=A0A397JG76_9GLOM|nr:hypothetical protein Glove_74g261 [Diversispora epigaea]
MPGEIWSMFKSRKVISSGYWTIGGLELVASGKFWLEDIVSHQDQLHVQNGIWSFYSFGLQLYKVPVLIELKIEHNAGQIDEEKLKQKVKSSWASNLSIPVFTFLISEVSSQLKIEKSTA